MDQNWMDRYKTLEPQFLRAEELVNYTVKERLLPATENELLDLYGLFKQVRLGDCPDDASASMWDVKGNRKFKAWRQLKGLDQVDAMQRYVDLVSHLCAKYHVIKRN